MDDLNGMADCQKVRLQLVRTIREVRPERSRRMSSNFLILPGQLERIYMVVIEPRYLPVYDFRTFRTSCQLIC
jgi:hypothetical protein